LTADFRLLTRQKRSKEAIIEKIRLKMSYAYLFKYIVIGDTGKLQAVLKRTEFCSVVRIAT
jgi:hypothetical protein